MIPKTLSIGRQKLAKLSLVVTTLGQAPGEMLRLLSREADDDPFA